MYTVDLYLRVRLACHVDGLKPARCSRPNAGRLVPTSHPIPHFGITGIETSSHVLLTQLPQKSPYFPLFPSFASLMSTIGHPVL